MAKPKNSDPQPDSDDATADAPAYALTAEELIRTHQAGIWRYLRALGCDAALADDLTQDTFLAALRSEFQQRSEAETAGYLRRIAYNSLVSWKRRERKVIAVENISAFDIAWERTIADDSGEDLIRILKSCLKKLTDRARRALQMRFAEMSTRIEIAEELGITEHGAKNLMQRAKKQLQACVESQLET